MEVALDISNWHRPNPLFIGTAPNHSADESPEEDLDIDIPSNFNKESFDDQPVVHVTSQSTTASALLAINSVTEKENTSPFEITEKFRTQYISMLDQRLTYLDDLSSLRPGWIHGSGDVPSTQVLDASKHFVLLMREYARHSPISKIPRLVIGPLSDGGLGFELHTQDDSAVFVTVKNDLSFELELKLRGQYESIQANSEYSHFANQALSLYDALTDS